MTEVQITIALVVLVCTVIAIRAFRRIRSNKNANDGLYHPDSKTGLSYDTGRDESQWRRAYSHR